MICKRIGYIDDVFHGKTGSHVTSQFMGGKWFCTCISFQVRKLCKHRKRLLAKMTAVEIDDIINNEDLSMEFPSNLNGINEIFGGSAYNNNEISALYGKPGSGKSLFAIQEAVYLSSIGKNVLFIDTEGSIIPMMKKWVPVFEKRFGKRKGKIFIESKKSLVGLMAYLGYSVILEYVIKAGKTTPSGKPSKAKKKGKLEFRVLENIPSGLEKITKDQKLDFVILDSLTSVLREFTKEAQNYPSRSDAIAFIMRELIRVQEDYDTGMLITNHACHSDDTMTITKESGIVHHKDVKIGDHALGIDSKGNTVWTRINDIYNAPYKGRMIHLKGKSTDQLVTPDHRVMVYPQNSYPSNKSLIDDGKYIRANDIVPSGVAVVRAGNKLANNLDIENLKISNPEDFLVGLYVAEGDKQQNKQYPNQKTVRFSLHMNEVNEIKQIINRLGYKCNTYTPGDNSGYISLGGDSGRKFCELINDIPNGAKNKVIPSSILKSNNTNKKLAFLAGYLYGDGHQATTNSWMFTTVSKTLVENLCELSTKLGFAINFRERIRTHTNLPRYKQSEGKIFQGSIRFTNKSWASPTDEYYEGNIWCFKTDTTNFAVIRGNQLTFSGNTFNPMDPYQTKADCTGGLVVKHYSKRVMYIDKREMVAVANYRRFWLVRSENSAAWSKAAITKINNEGYHDITDIEERESCFTVTELSRL